jgi:hypothetical protein
MLLVSQLLIFGIQRHPVIHLHTFQEQHLQRGLPTCLAHETLISEAELHPAGSRSAKAAQLAGWIILG